MSNVVSVFAPSHHDRTDREAAVAPNERYRFGDFELEVGQARLTDAGRVVSLQPQPFKVLAILVSRAGELVTRDEMIREIWGDSTHVDFDRGLNYCIRQVRRALGDDASEPRFVQTVPRRGYRFVAEVVGPVARASAQPRLTKGLGRRAVLAAAGFSSLALVAAAGIFLSSRSPNDAPTNSPQAIQELVSGRLLLENPTPKNVAAARTRFERALSIDPDFAPAHLALAQASIAAPTERAAQLDESLRHVHRALELDPELEGVHLHLANLELYGNWNWDRAEEAYLAAVDRAPNSARAHHAYATFLAMRGQLDGAIDHVQQALVIDPVSAALKGDAGWFYFQAGRFSEAKSTCESALGLEPTNENALWCLLQVSRFDNRPVHALDAATRLATLLGHEPAEPFEELTTFWSWYLDWIDKKPERATPSARGLAHLALGEHDHALDIFEHAAEAKAPCVLALAADPQTEPLRGDPRFERLLETIGLSG